MYGKETQKTVGCSVPFCEERHCNRQYKRFCALRRYFLMEVVRLRTYNNSVYYFWRSNEYKRKQIEESSV